MTKVSMAAGDPFCPIHGFTPCMCGQYPNLGDPFFYNPYCNLGNLMFQVQIPCSGCKKHPSVCVCGATSNPYHDMRALEGATLTPRNPNEPVKKWADELKETAKKVNDAKEVEGRSAYYFFLERSKLAAKKGNFSATFWMSCLPWTKEEIAMAANLLRQDNFQVSVEPADDLQQADIEIKVSW